MAARPGISAGIQRPVDPGKSPNTYMAYITAEVRVYWPPHVSDDEIDMALHDAILEARRLIANRRTEIAPMTEPPAENRGYSLPDDDSPGEQPVSDTPEVPLAQTPNDGIGEEGDGIGALC